MRIQLFLCGLLLSSFGFGQLKIVEPIDLVTDINLTTVESTGLPTDFEIDKVVWVINTSGATLSLKCKKTEIGVLANTRNTTCWKLCPSVYDWAGGVPSGFVTLGGTQMVETVAPGDTIKSFAGHYMPMDLDGCSLFQYEWYDQNDLNTPLASINVRYLHTAGTCTAGIGNYENNVGIKLMPNPASNLVSVNIEGSDDYKGISIEVFDMLGKKLETVLQVKSSTILNIDSYKNGIYFVSVKRNGILIRTSKLVKED